jgi:hypothetical protein
VTLLRPLLALGATLVFAVGAAPAGAATVLKGTVTGAP